MERIVLQAQPRKELGKNKVNKLRRQGYIPAIVYSEDKKTEALKIAAVDFLKIVHQHHIENTVVNLKVNPTGTDKRQKEYACLVKEIQYEPVKADIMHIDFQRISLTETVKVEVPVVVKGEAVGVKQEDGVLEHILWELEIECLPAQIPEQIEIEVSNLKVNEVIQVKDIKTPTGVKILNPADSIILMVAAPKQQEVEAPVAEEEIQERAEPEVIKEKKEIPTEKEAPQG
jgi:large subunit ribosomal protein L25